MKARLVRDNIAFLVMIFGPVVLLWRVLFGGEVLYWGTALLQFVPWRRLAIESLFQGHLPLWNPNLGMGAPLLANYQSALLYPPNWILFLVGPEWGQGLLVAAHLAWAGCGMVVLARRLNLSLPAQILSGVSFSLSGYLVARGGFLSINAAASWLPWLVYWVDRLASQAGDGEPAPKVGVAAGWMGLGFGLQWLSGHAQMAWYSLVLVGAWGLWRAWSRARLRSLIRFLGWFLGTLGLGFALAAVQLLPTFEYLAQSGRGTGVDLDFALTYSFSPIRALGVLLPDLVGSPVSGDFHGYGNYWEDAIYIGVLPFLLASAAIVQSLRGNIAHKGLIRFLAVMGAAAVILALGKNTPVFPFLFRHIPTFGLFQAPARWNLLTVFGLALLAGIGFEAWRPAEGRGLYWARLGTAAAVGMLVTAWLAMLALPDVNSSLLKAFVILGFWLALGGIAWILSASERFRGSGYWMGFVVGLVVIDLLLAGRGLNPSISGSLYKGDSQLADRVSKEHRLYMPSEIEYEVKFEYSHRFDTYDPGIDWRSIRDFGLPNVTVLDGLHSANNFDPLLPGRFVTWMEELDKLPGSQQETLLGLMDVGWVARMDAGDAESIRYEMSANPARVRVVGQALWVGSEQEALAAVFDPSFQPNHLVVLEGQALPSGDGQGGGGVAEIAPFMDPNMVEVKVGSEGYSWLVLSDTWYPGWQAELDGERVEIHRADYLFRAVSIPPGDHTVRFMYSPLSFIVGLALSAGAWLVLVGMAARWKRS